MGRDDCRMMIPGFSQKKIEFWDGSSLQRLIGHQILVIHLEQSEQINSPYPRTYPGLYLASEFF